MCFPCEIPVCLKTQSLSSIGNLFLLRPFNWAPTLDLNCPRGIFLLLPKSSFTKNKCYISVLLLFWLSISRSRISGCTQLSSNMIFFSNTKHLYTILYSSGISVIGVQRNFGFHSPKYTFVCFVCFFLLRKLFQTNFFWCWVKTEMLLFASLNWLWLLSKMDLSYNKCVTVFVTFQFFSSEIMAANEKVFRLKKVVLKYCRCCLLLLLLWSCVLCFLFETNYLKIWKQMYLCQNELFFCEKILISFLSWKRTQT